MHSLSSTISILLNPFKKKKKSYGKFKWRDHFYFFSALFDSYSVLEVSAGKWPPEVMWISYVEVNVFSCVVRASFQVCRINSWEWRTITNSDTSFFTYTVQIWYWQVVLGTRDWNRLGRNLMFEGYRCARTFFSFIHALLFLICDSGLM